MPDTPKPRQRAPRSDGARNRRLLLEAAARAFATDGAEATLTAIARDAGVGIGTLFRHFPTREDLVEAAYSNSLEHLCAAAAELAAAAPPEHATRRWMGRYLDYMSQRQGMAETVRAMVADGIDSRVQTVERLTAAVEILIAAGRSSGAFTADARADDVVALLAGIAVVAGRPAQRAQADRMVGIVLTGLGPAA